MLFAMGLNPQGNIECFWSHVDHEYKRFEALFHSFLHTAGARVERQEKIEPFLNKLTKSFQTAYYPDKQVSIDEMVIGYHGRWKYK